MNSFPSLLRWCAVAALTALALYALHPGISGGFLFDDYVNLSALGDYGGVRDGTTLALYLTSALGDPLGRPLSMLSFLLDARSWPADPQPFLRDNVLLHLCNGILLTFVIVQLGLRRGLAHRHAWLAGIVAAGAWLLHPMFLSTTLYVVQREAMLAACFSLLGLLAWLRGSRLWLAGSERRGLIWLCIGAIGCTALAALCKANGLLLPLLLLVVEATVLHNEALRTNAGFVRARRALLGIPLVLTSVALLLALPDFIDKAARDRPWSIGQRLLTEPRALLDYLGLLFVPHPISHGVFHDDFAASVSLFDPASTWLCIAAVAAAVVGAWRVRKRWPAVACALLFFFAGHVLESSFVPLELYFEHRNYLPAMLAFWPVALALTSAAAPLRTVRLIAALLLLLGLAASTYLGAQTWGQPRQLAFAWAERNPDSARAQAYAAQYEMADGDNTAAQQRLVRSLRRHPHETQLAFNLVDAQCRLGGVSEATLAQVREAVEHDDKAAALDFTWLRAAVDRARSASCPGLTLDAIAAILDAVRRNARFAAAPGRVQDFTHIEGLILLARDDVTGASAAFQRALDTLPQPAIALQQAALLSDAGRPELALAHLNAFALAHPPEAITATGWSVHALHERLLQRIGYWRDEFAHMRQLLEQQAHAQPTPRNPL